MLLTSTVKKLILGFLLLFTFGQMGQAQEASESNPNDRRAYWSTGLDGSILSSSLLSKGGNTSKMTLPRFTAFLHFGGNLNYDVSKHFGIYTGLGIKNIGFIEKNGGVSTIRRNYTIGIPLGIKFGKMNYGSFGFLGTGIDFPFNYKEKSFTKRTNKDVKFNEWFSDRSPAAMGYVFVGAYLQPGMTLKLQYYPGNFLNPNFEVIEDGIALRPYAGYEVHLILLSLGLNIDYKPKTGSSIKSKTFY